MPGYCNTCGKPDTNLDPYTARCAGCLASWVTSRTTVTLTVTSARWERSP